MDELVVGRVTHYFPQIQVAAVEVTGDTLRIGDTVRVLGATSNFTQRIHSIEIDHAPVDEGQVGQLVAIQLVERARVKDLILRIRPHAKVDNRSQ